MSTGVSQYMKNIVNRPVRLSVCFYHFIYSNLSLSTYFTGELIRLCRTCTFATSVVRSVVVNLMCCVSCVSHQQSRTTTRRCASSWCSAFTLPVPPSSLSSGCRPKVLIRATNLSQVYVTYALPLTAFVSDFSLFLSLIHI